MKLSLYKYHYDQYPSFSKKIVTNYKLYNNISYKINRYIFSYKSFKFLKIFKNLKIEFFCNYNILI